MLELYTHPMSPCAPKMRIVLAEKGLEWTAHHVNLQEKENLEPWHLKLNPLGVAPTLAPYFQTLLQFDWVAFLEADCPRVVDWFERCRARPSYRQPVADDFPAELMAELGPKGAGVWHKIAAHLG